MPHTHVTTTRTWLAACAAFIAAWAGFISSCDTPTPRSSDARRISAFDTTASCAVSDVEATCDHCIVIDHVVALGAGDGEGFLEDNGTLRAIVRDSSGRYWVGQRETVKVFDSQGRFITSVGRSGRGPMEFAFAQPVHLDASGRVHILDVRNLRLTIVSPDLTVAEERRLPGPVNAAAPLEDGDRYVVQMWAPTPERRGYPLHILAGDSLALSFGITLDPHGQPLSRFNAMRVLTVDEGDTIFSSRYYDYSVEIWNASGDRVGRLEGPVLNDFPVVPGVRTADHPPANKIVAMSVDDADRLWIMVRYRRPDWREHMEERVAPDGRVALLSKDGQITSYYRTRIDVVDLMTCRMVASQLYDGVMLSFIRDGLAAELVYATDGSPRVQVQRVGLAADRVGTSR